jgi:hypothetical protein
VSSLEQIHRLRNASSALRRRAPISAAGQVEEEFCFDGTCDANSEGCCLTCF